MFWLGHPALLLPAMEDLEQHPYGGHGRYGTIRTCRWQCRLAAVAVMRWLPLALTGHDDTEDVSAHGGAAARRPVLNA
jgi:hypothetical protein